MNTSHRTEEAALHGGLPENNHAATLHADSTTHSRPRRNAGRCGTWRGPESGRAKPAAAGAGGRPATVRDTWIRWLSPHFADNDSCYFTGTYSDAYGFPYGLTLPRNVMKDWERFLEHSTGFLALGDRRYIVGVEKHAYRDILHLHGIIQGPFSDDDRRYLKACWQGSDRGFCKPLPVLDGCASYVTKYALKGDTDSFEWRL